MFRQGAADMAKMSAQLGRNVSLETFSDLMPIRAKLGRAFQNTSTMSTTDSPAHGGVSQCRA